MSRVHTDTLGSPAVEADATTPSTLMVARAGLWTLLAAHLVTVWGTQWDIRWPC